jgi:hypothetical protein
MTDDEMQKTIEFLLEQQAQFVTRVQRDEERLARLEDAFATLVRIARIGDERLDVLESGLSSLTEKMTALVEAQARTDARIGELAEAQAHSDQRMNALIDIVERYISRGGNGGSPS